MTDARYIYEKRYRLLRIELRLREELECVCEHSHESRVLHAALAHHTSEEGALRSAACDRGCYNAYMAGLWSYINRRDRDTYDHPKKYRMMQCFGWNNTLPIPF